MAVYCCGHVESLLYYANNVTDVLLRKKLAVHFRCGFIGDVGEIEVHIGIRRKQYTRIYRRIKNDFMQKPSATIECH